MRKLIGFFPILLLITGCASWRMKTVTTDQLGSEMQATAPAKLRPLQLASLGSPIQSEFHIHSGDMLDVTVSDLIGENQYYPVPTRVLEDGTVRLPLVGAVTLAGCVTVTSGSRKPSRLTLEVMMSAASSIKEALKNSGKFPANSSVTSVRRSCRLPRTP